MKVNPLKVQTCHLPCIVAKITAHKDGYISFKCPKDCAFRKYQTVKGPLDKWMTEGAGNEKVWDDYLNAIEDSDD